MEKAVLFEVESGIALITLNRPERRNAINQELLVHFYQFIDEVAANDDIRVAIVTGNGKSFCSGIDLQAILTENLFDPMEDGRHFMDVMDACTKPVIGAINGHAITGGFEMVLNFDFLIASERASFTDTHTKVGIHPGWGMTQLLQEAVGRRMAKQMSMTGQPISAQRAMECGLVNEVVPYDELLPRAKQVAQEICAVNQVTMMAMKELIEYRSSTSLEGALTEERKRFLAYVEMLKSAR